MSIYQPLTISCAEHFFSQAGVRKDGYLCVLQAYIISIHELEMHLNAISAIEGDVAIARAKSSHRDSSLGPRDVG